MNKENVKLHFVPTSQMTMDILTEILEIVRFSELMKLLCVEKELLG